MITALIFSAHFIFTLIVFTKKWQDESVISGLLNIGLIGILFSVGWTITGFISQAIMEPKGFGIFFDRDTFSLTLLTAGELFFYKMYFKDVFISKNEEITEAGKEKQ
jgi:hypothetical protein